MCVASFKVSSPQIIVNFCGVPYQIRNVSHHHQNAGRPEVSESLSSSFLKWILKINSLLNYCCFVVTTVSSESPLGGTIVYYKNKRENGHSIQSQKFQLWGYKSLILDHFYGKYNTQECVRQHTTLLGGRVVKCTGIISMYSGCFVIEKVRMNLHRRLSSNTNSMNLN